MLATNRSLGFGKWVLIAFLAFIIGFDGYLAFTAQAEFNYSKILLLLTLIAIIAFKNKFTWILGTTLFVWSLYYIIIKTINTPTPSFYEFTSSLYFLINQETYAKIYLFVHSFPVYFNFLSLLIFSTYPVRRWYGISAKKAPKIKTYLK